MLHQKMQKFQRRLFYAPVCSEDSALIENSKDSATNKESNTSIKIVNLTLGFSLRANGHICDVLRLIKHAKLHASCCITFSRLAHRRNRKSGQATRDNANEPDLYLSVANPFLGRKSKFS
jgi:hypothetical protein